MVARDDSPPFPHRAGRAATTLQPRLSAPAASPWRQVSVVYAILALALFAFPGGIVDWLDERNASGWLDAPLAIARGVDAASAATGVKGIGQSLRKQFGAIIGGDEG